MPVCDITGRVHDGMWGSPPPFPTYHLHHIPQPAWVEHPVFMESFEGLHSQTGTYLETPAHWYGNTYQLIDVPVEKLMDLPCVILRLPEPVPGDSRPPVTQTAIEQAIANAGEIPAGAAILVACGWGKHWDEPFYISAAPYFTREAMERIIALAPFLLGSDIPAWENRDDPQNFFESFYAADILMLAPVVRLEDVPADAENLRLTALAPAIEGTSCVPCRAVLRWD
ncbi:MAG: cyclase family protein [Ruminococcaceae bacterium]|nr:cyclase family protein [Oscillospiraceae bacterium]